MALGRTISAEGAFRRGGAGLPGGAAGGTGIEPTGGAARGVVRSAGGGVEGGATAGDAPPGVSLQNGKSVQHQRDRQPLQALLHRRGQRVEPVHRSEEEQQRLDG